MSFSDIMYPFEWLVAWIMHLWHGALTAIGLPEASGWTWTLSIVGLVVVMRAALIPLFVKQIHASRKMQLIQPEMAKIQAKYKGKNDPDSRQKMTEETMALYKDSGTNPFASCLPIFAQMPFFFGLFRVLNSLDEIGAGTKSGIGPITQEVAAQAESSTIFGAQLSAQFLGTDGGLSVKIVTITLIILMSLTTFTTQYQLMRKNMPAAALEGQFAQQQKIMLYLFPIIFAVSGVYFPIGVLIYWFTTNLWTMCQQFYVIRRMPAPGSAAEKAMQDRRRKAGKPLDTPEEARERAHDAEMAEELTAKGVISGQRQQPTSKRRAKKKGGPPPKSGGSAVSEQKPKTDN
ncbi:membrane protein insertase YidC [Janibacter hoylei]|uniref:membrane protein insertase YidC n=1 Tax=Janibacter hoylei TaxID=364298 RepID=UPI0021A77C97|nr:membrane protein insertase YidC [Janibacter hoylei]MCT1619103.1 membrane protein insertase YidC [Janibacter hoylei]MCT2293193.1 membrane protein insertase YidC [Janibacter hoylei]